MDPHPTPWRAEEFVNGHVQYWTIRDANGEYVKPYGKTDDLAARIVAAVNAHDQLRAVCFTVIDEWHGHGNIANAVAKAEAALAATRGAEGGGT